MREIHERLHIGTDRDCFTRRDGWAIVHACKSPCHQHAVGYRGNLPKTHPHYLVLERDNNLYLNMHVLIHCNLGTSRAPSLALVFLAKHAGVITNGSFAAAAKEFADKIGGYHPSAGIRAYLFRHWDELAPA
jgi:hypothetical protein